MESSRPKEKWKTKEHITPGNGDRHEKNEQELDGIRKEGPGQSAPVILRELVLSDEFDPVSPNFTVRKVTTELSGPRPTSNYPL
ncbi:unnamed protein product [Schistosoma curassoni]|uniref:HABP4_PAI-RBP1 domain-containing protein n=1 Tax=Schistosoma curassoni TaxID=6186 RepID=A0A183K3K9_9TREM|nr:unnamed protein product [Schistosoma curassoni]